MPSTESERTDVTAVVIVDDNGNVRQVMQDILADEGYQVTALAEGRHLISYLRAQPEPVVVILDRVLPGLDALDLLVLIAAEPDLADRHAYILCTASTVDWPESVAQVLGQLHVPLLQKPFDLEELLRVVAGVAARIRV